MAYENIITPFSRIVKWKYKPAEAFFTFPHNDTELGGWGQPYELPDGTTVPPPGTPISGGGFNPYRRLYYDTDTNSWDLKRTPGDWVYGNIDWRGPEEDAKDNQKYSIKLSFHGPPARYFPHPGFVYGADAKHNEIYCRGQYADVAPLPVLGASYFEYTDPATSVTTQYTAAICRDSLEDVLFIKERGGLTAPSAYDAFIRASLSAKYKPPTNNTGWREVLRVPRQTTDGENATSPDTPWFFSENGKKAQCVRRFSKTFDNGRETVTEVGINRYQITITSGGAASFLNFRNTNGYAYKDETVKDSFPHIYGYEGYSHCGPGCDYEFSSMNPDAPYDCGWHWETNSTLNASSDCGAGAGGATYTSHYWGFDNLHQKITMEGEYIVGVDYVGNDEVLIKCEYDMYYEMQKYYRYNIDRYMADVDTRNREWEHIYSGQRGAYCEVEDYLDPPLDGRRYKRWSWYDSNGNITNNIDNAVCEYNGGYTTAPGDPADPSGGEYQGNKIQKYLDDGQPIPPDTLYNNQGQLAEYNVTGTISLKYAHPSDPLNPRRVYLYWNNTESSPLNWFSQTVLANKLSGREFFWAQPLHLDVRPVEGTFGVFRTERKTHDNLGVIPIYRDGSYGKANGGWDPFDPFYSDSMLADERDHDTYIWVQRGDIKEEVTFEYIDPFSDPATTQLIAREEGDEYEKQITEADGGEAVEIKDIRGYDPTGADNNAASTNHPTSNTAWINFVRNDFDWVYEVTILNGRCPSEQDYTDENLEPHFRQWFTEAYGYPEWPSWSEVISMPSYIEGGYGWQANTGVCFSVKYLTSEGALGVVPPNKPVTAPIPDALKQVKYVNYLTGGDLENSEPPADRYYPIGVE